MIVVIERPIIGNVQVSALRFDQLRVSWVISFDGNLPPPICHVNYSTTSTGLFLSSPGSPVTDVSHIVTDLQPYTEYYVQVQCTNKVGSSNNLLGGPQRTLKTNPSEPRNLHATDIQPDRFNVEWVEPATKNGPVDGYKINVTRHSDGAIIKMAQVTGRSFPVEGLTAYTEYTVVVIAFNTEGGQDLASNPTQQIFRTAQDAPTPPRNVQSINLPGTCNVSWGRPENENGIIQSYKVIYSAYPRPESSENSATDKENSGSYDVNGNQMTFVFNKSNHAAYSEFRFNVSATTVAEGNPSDVSNGSCITNPAAPAEGAVSVPLQGTPDDPEEEAITPSSFYMTLTPADERNGPISCYNIIVKELNEDEGIDGLNPDQEYPQKKVGTYESSQGNREPYIAFVKDGSDVTSRLNIKIGEGRPTRCGAPGSRRKRQTMYDHFGDNGGLKADTRYTAFVRAFVKVRDGNSEEYRSSPFMQPIKTAAGPSVAGIAIGIILAILVIIVIVLGALIYMKRRQTTPLLRGEENGVAMVQVKDKEPEMTHMVVLPIPIEDLEEKVKQKSQNDDEVFKAEFKSIPEATGDVTRDATNLECNKEKNRYINIGAYDQTRVKLSVIDDVEGSDYINACYIDGYEKSRKFIAAQGPREDTVLDFWRMIWEQNCATIIMLTKCLENGREKCAEYWPEEDAIMYDDIIVTLDDVVTCADYVIRKFTMQKDEEDEDAEPIVGESRTLMQFHFLGWPDFGIPKYPHSMLCFVKRIRHMTGTRIEPGNIVVHCSAGVGRTGTYILIDYMLDMMKKEKKVDIYNVIYSLRSQRNLLVQSLVQYIFIHKALMEEYLYGHTEVDVGSMRHYYQKLCGKASDGEDKYRAMASLPVDNTDQKTGNIEANKQKNRLRQVIPYDRNRVKLERLTGQEHSNYINASFIDGYEHKKAYVAAQGPLPNTMGDFWRMAWENQCSTIVMLSECEERGQNVCTKYWPEAGETLNPAFLTVAVKEVKEDDDCTIRDLEVSTTKGAGTKLIRQYHYHGWPEVGIPDNSASLVKVIGLAHEYQQDIGRFPILVHCSAGSGRTGVFIALSYLLQRAKAEGIVDVFQAVRTLRQQRPHMVQDVAQYQFCYRAMNEYLDSFDHYANFK
ncbi:receptor-type tyrosine-protein phosphatase epsilon-like [Acanthaster planci]|uniref:protein-tyrosine-phosphatase n=1 Tax=Acanthaster planci TaxID=133434 RepID=A0A8B7ZI05_ACAPL|nr:receptor-type tyrosine-protein phosphatase epsilon-like [Acanthaster planci]